MNLFQLGDFVLHSGERSFFKIECDALTEDDWKALAAMAMRVLKPFGHVVSIPTGGDRFALALRAHVTAGCKSVVITDDVLTTGASMERVRRAVWATAPETDFQGVVAFSRIPQVPSWIRALFISGEWMR